LIRPIGDEVENEMTRTRRLLLIRHGLPDYSLHKALDEPPGPPLSNTGIIQVRQVIPIVQRLAPIAVYASPLTRARQSAALVADALGLPVRVESDLKEWHRTERLYQVNERSARWLARWLRRDEPCAVVFGHASPLLSILRTALYLPHFTWWRPNNSDHLVLGTCDRFELSMGSLFEIVFEPETVTARCLHHPHPRIVRLTRGRVGVAHFPRPTMTGENREVRRPNFGPLIGYRG
jgi:broad specificity phosphatase PhoE